MSTVWAEIRDSVGFSEEDSALLRSFFPAVEPRLESVADALRARISSHPEAVRVMDAEALDRTVVGFIDWMRSCLSGPHDRSDIEKRAQLGRMQVRAGLPQRFVVKAINLVRLELRRIADERWDRADKRRSLDDAIDRLLDLELAFMLEHYREDSDDRFRGHERLAAIGQIAATIGHDLRNPLSVIESSVYILRRNAESEHAQKHFDKIDHQIKICDQIITDLLGLARNREPKLLPSAAREVLIEAIEGANVPDATVSIDVEPGMCLQIDPGLIRLALVNLVVNAVQAQDAGKAKVELTARAEGVVAILECADSGPGFDPQILPVAFQPTITNKPDGTGLGLALVKSIVDRHGGTVEAQNRPQGGAIIRIRLPGGVAT
jgi:two-component system sensor histidine kinase HydH